MHSPSYLSISDSYPSIGDSYLSFSDSYLSFSDSYLSFNDSCPSFNGSYPSFSDSYPSFDASYLSFSDPYPSFNGSYLSISDSYPSLDGSLVLIIQIGFNDAVCHVSRADRWFQFDSRTVFGDCLKYFRYNDYLLFRILLLCGASPNTGYCMNMHKHRQGLRMCFERN